MKLSSGFSLLAISILATSCSYFTRSNCEKLNWFEEGQQIALRGQYPANDPNLKECRKVEANIDEGQLDSGFKRGRELYCQPERAFQVGKDGKLFNPDICEANQSKALLRAHQNGVRAYCVPDMGKQLGASGAEYNTICPSDLEAAFHASYQKARRAYLEGILPGLERQYDQKQSEASSLRAELGYLQGQRAALQAQAGFADASFDPTGSNAIQTSNLQGQISSLDNDISLKEMDANSAESEAHNILSQITRIKGEIAGLKD